MLQSSLPWPSSFQAFLWDTAGSLTPSASWPGQPGYSLDAAILLALALKLSTPSVGCSWFCKLSNLPVGHSWFMNSLSILARRAWMLQSSLPWT